MPKSRVALRIIFGIAVVVWTSHTRSLHVRVRICINVGMQHGQSYPLVYMRLYFQRSWCTAKRVLCGIAWRYQKNPLSRLPGAPRGDEYKRYLRLVVRTRTPQRKIVCIQVAFAPEDSRGVS